MTTTEEIINYYDNFLDYLKHDHKRENPRHAKIKKDLSKIVKKGMNVLDVGCGTGITTKYIAELGAKVVDGVDISPRLIEFARKYSMHPNVRYLVMDITKPFSSLGYDLICLIDIMEHIPKLKIRCLFDNLRKCSCESTIIYLNIPDARFQEWMKENYPDKLQIIDEAYSIEEIVHLFHGIRFEPIWIEIYGIDFPVQYTSYVFVKKERIFRKR